MNRVLGLATVLLVSVSCTEDALVGVDPDSSPGQAAETVRVQVGAAALPLWLDTTFVGFAVPATSGIQLLSTGGTLNSRVLSRIETIPDSLFVDTARVAITEYQSAALRLIVDTLASSALPDSGTDIRMHALSRAFELREASWTEARSGEPWTTPGGDLGELLGTIHIDSLQDTLLVPLSTDVDSLLTEWRDSDGEFGYVLSASADGATLAFSSQVLVFDIMAETQDTTIELVRGPRTQTFIFEPATPDPASALRLGGLPAARTYVRFELPDSLDGVPLRGARINRASLFLRSTGAPAPPFATTDTTFASMFELLADPFDQGAKTPIGGGLGTLIELDPVALGAGEEQELNITGLVQSWAAAAADSTVDLRFGIRMQPEGAAVGFWEFGQLGDVGAEPRLELLVTPPTEFDVP